MDIVTLIPACRKGVDGFSVETCRLLKDPAFQGVLHFLVTGESLTFKKYFKGAEDMLVTWGHITITWGFSSYDKFGKHTPLLSEEIEQLAFVLIWRNALCNQLRKLS